jgi:hypothetical protein
MPVLTRWTIALTLLAAAAATGGDAPAAVATAPASPATRHSMGGSGRLTLGPGQVRIPFDRRGNHIYMRGRVNDSDSLWIVLDSGASGNVIDAALAKRLGLEVSSRGQGRGAGGTVEAGQVRSVTLRLPGATLEGAPIATMPLEPFRRQTGRSMDAIVGAPLLDRCVLRVDYAARTIELLPAETFEYTGRGAILPLSFIHRHPYVEARVTLPGREPIEGRFVIDLGSSQALILTPTFIRERGVMETLPRTIEGRGRGVGGIVPSRIGRVARIEVGGYGFDQPITGLPVSEKSMVGASDAIGNIGGEILRRFTVTFDYARRRMILEPNAQFGDPFEADMSGIAPRMGPDGSDALEVEWVQSDSPASEAGLKDADLIEAVDGKPALEVGVPALREMFRRAGATHRLTIRRGEERKEVTITTRRLI